MRALPEHYDWLNLLPITNLAPILALVMVKRANLTAYVFVSSVSLLFRIANILTLFLTAPFLALLLRVEESDPL